MRSVHKSFYLLIMLSLVLMGCSEPSVTQSMRGSGTVSDPYIIETVEHLVNVGNNMSSHYRQVADLDLTGIEWSPIGSDYDDAFTGVYDGGGKRISHLQVTQLAGGLFYHLGAEGTIRNVVIEDASVTYDRPWGVTDRPVGLLSSYASGTIEYCSVSGEIDTPDNFMVGGLVGNLTSTGADGIYWSRATDMTINGSHYVGGLVGAVTSSSLITQCFATGTVTANYADGEADVGGLVGNINASEAEVMESYALCTVIDATTGTGGRVGGLIGSAYAGGFGVSLSNLYFQGHVTSRADGYGGAIGALYNGDTITMIRVVHAATFTGPLSTAPNTRGTAVMIGDLKTSDTFSPDFNFISTWGIDEDSSFPYLRNNEQEPHPTVL